MEGGHQKMIKIQMPVYLEDDFKKVPKYFSTFANLLMPFKCCSHTKRRRLTNERRRLENKHSKVKFVILAISTKCYISTKPEEVIHFLIGFE